MSTPGSALGPLDIVLALSAKAALGPLAGVVLVPSADAPLPILRF